MTYETKSTEGWRLDRKFRRHSHGDAQDGAGAGGLKWVAIDGPKAAPEVMRSGIVFAVAQVLIRRHLFISLFRVCDESLVIENATVSPGGMRRLA